MLEGREAVIVERLSKPGAIGLMSQVGGRLPLHSSAVGKVLLAHADSALFDALAEDGLSRFTPHTITDPERLRRELGDCRRTGTAIVRGETTPDADSVATRIMGADGWVVAALSVVVRSSSVALPAVIPSVVTSGLGISRRLGWTPDVGVRGQALRQAARSGTGKRAGRGLGTHGRSRTG